MSAQVADKFQVCCSAVSGRAILPLPHPSPLSPGARVLTTLIPTCPGLLMWSLMYWCGVVLHGLSSGQSGVTQACYLGVKQRLFKEGVAGVSFFSVSMFCCRIGARFWLGMLRTDSRLQALLA